MTGAERDRLLRRIGLDAAPPPDVEGLRKVHRAFVSSVPYEDLAVQLGESAPLDPDALVERVCTGGRGGYCFEANTVLCELLRGLGFDVTRHLSIVDERDAHLRDVPVNHMALVARTAAGEAFLAESGWGEGPLDPLPLREGVVRAGAFTCTIEREGDGWWVAKDPPLDAPGLRLADGEATLADFAPHHERLSTSPASSFVRTLIVQMPYDDRVETLRARTLFVDGPGLRERRVLADREAFAVALRDRFGIEPDVLGPERLARLWRAAEAQHEAHRASVAAGG